MAFSVIVTETAEADIDDAASSIAQESNAAASRWIAGLGTLLSALQEMPFRYFGHPGSRRSRPSLPVSEPLFTSGDLPNR